MLMKLTPSCHMLFTMNLLHFVAFSKEKTIMLSSKFMLYFQSNYVASKQDSMVSVITSEKQCNSVNANLENILQHSSN